MGLKLKDLSILSQEKRQILVFTYKGLSIHVLPPLRRIIAGKETFDSKYSVFINKLHIDLLRKPEFNKVAERWFQGNNYDEFKKQFDQMIFYSVYNPNSVNHEGTELRRHLTDILPFVDYQNKYNLIYEIKSNKANTSREMFELNDIRAKSQVSLWTPNEVIKFDDVRIIKEANKKFNFKI